MIRHVFEILAMKNFVSIIFKLMLNIISNIGVMRLIV